MANNAQAYVATTYHCISQQPPGIFHARTPRCDLLASSDYYFENTSMMCSNSNYWSYKLLHIALFILDREPLIIILEGWVTLFDVHSILLCRFVACDFYKLQGIYQRDTAVRRHCIQSGTRETISDNTHSSTRFCAIVLYFERKKKQWCMIKEKHAAHKSRVPTKPFLNINERKN